MAGPQRCAFCHDERPEVECVACHTWLHRACWAQVERCPTLGCSTTTPPRSWWREVLARAWAGLTDLASSPADLAREVLSRAVEHESVGEYEQAEKLLDGVLAREASCAPALLRRAEVRRTRGDLEGARKDARALVDLPTDGRWRRDTSLSDLELRSRAWLLVGQACEQMGDEEAADDAFAQVDRLASEGDPIEDLVLLQPRAAAREARWDFAGALADLEVGYSGFADLEHVAALERRRGRLDAAVTLLDRVLLEIDVDRPTSLLARWQARTIRGDDAARRDLERAAVVVGDDPQALSSYVSLHRGIDAALRGDREDAAARLDAAGRASPFAVCAWQWSVALDLRGPTDPPLASDPWQQAQTDLFAGSSDGDALLERARAAPGRRARARRLHEAHACLALIAAGRGDRDGELQHLREAASWGDMGSLVDAWIHGRARLLGSPVEHRPPRPA
ncbi:MAG: hypothetical protein KIT58_12990 [Planctomycetota bacterium]|nr:hypothetical protein [Planctomycetota bacterium]